MQSAEDVRCDNLPVGGSRPEHCRIARRALPKRSMRTPMIEVADIRGHYSTQTSFAEDEYVVEALGTHRFDPTLRNRIRSRRPERRPDLLNAKVSHAALERRTITAVAVVNEKTWRPSIPSAAFDYLLGSPLRRRTWRYRDVQNFSIDVPDHKKRRTASGTRLFEHRRSRTPIYSIHAVSGTLAIPAMALDCGADSCTWRRSWQKR
jgi:hypothetical protein